MSSIMDPAIGAGGLRSGRWTNSADRGPGSLPVNEGYSQYEKTQIYQNDSRDNEKGGTLAELAILVPFLIIMAASVSELGRLFQTYTTLSKSTRAAARYLSGQA